MLCETKNTQLSSSPECASRMRLCASAHPTVWSWLRCHPVWIMVPISSMIIIPRSRIIVSWISRRCHSDRSSYIMITMSWNRTVVISAIVRIIKPIVWNSIYINNYISVSTIHINNISYLGNNHCISCNTSSHHQTHHDEHTAKQLLQHIL